MKNDPSIKEVLSRTFEPTIETRYWSRLPGNFVDSISGLSTKKTDIQDPFEWNETIVRVIDAASNTLHRQTLVGPATFIVVNEFAKWVVETTVGYKSFVEVPENIVPNFVDAKPIGILDRKLTVFSSKEMPGNRLLIGRHGDGFEYVVWDSNSTIPEININLSTKPHLQKGQVAFWGFIEILHVSLNS